MICTEQRHQIQPGQHREAARQVEHAEQDQQQRRGGKQEAGTQNVQQLLDPGKFPEAAVELQRYEQGNHADRHPRESRMQCRQKAAVAHECVDTEVESRQQRQQACQIQQHDVEQHQACDADDELPVDFGFALFHRLSLISALSCRSPAGLSAGGRSPACTSAGAATAHSRPGSRAPCA